MKASSVLGGDYIKAETVKEDGPQRLVIVSVDITEFEAKKGKTKPERRLELTFTDDRKLTLNNGNTQVLIAAFGDDTDEWEGKAIIAFHDPSVMFGSKRVGGVKVKVPAAKVVAKPVADAPAEADPADTDPFA